MLKLLGEKEQKKYTINIPNAHLLKKIITETKYTDIHMNLMGLSGEDHFLHFYLYEKFLSMFIKINVQKTMINKDYRKRLYTFNYKDFCNACFGIFNKRLEIKCPVYNPNILKKINELHLLPCPLNELVAEYTYEGTYIYFNDKKLLYTCKPQINTVHLKYVSLQVKSIELVNVLKKLNEHSGICIVVNENLELIIAGFDPEMDEIINDTYNKLSYKNISVQMCLAVYVLKPLYKLSKKLLMTEYITLHIRKNSTLLIDQSIQNYYIRYAISYYKLDTSIP